MTIAFILISKIIHDSNFFQKSKSRNSTETKGHLLFINFIKMEHKSMNFKYTAVQSKYYHAKRKYSKKSLKTCKIRTLLCNH